MPLKCLLVFLISIAGLGQMIEAFNFTEEEHNAGLIFINHGPARVTYDTHTMVYHTDISEYKNLTTTIEKAINDIEKFCKPTDTTLKFLISQMRAEITHMNRDVQDFEAYQQNQQNLEKKDVIRGKRSLDFIGSAYHWAVGLTDAETAKDMYTNIWKNSNDSARLQILFNKQTTLIKEEIKVTKGHVQQMKRQIASLQQQSDALGTRRLDEYRQQVKQREMNETITKSIDIIQFMILEHQRISKQLIESLQHSGSGKITQLVPIQRLKNDLAFIEGNLKEDQKLPINIDRENPLHIFKFTTVTAALYNNELIVHITIPIIEIEHYTLYKIIPIPTNVNGTQAIILPTTRFVVINNKNNAFTPISHDEYYNSKINVAGEQILKPAENSYSDYTKNCELNILINPNKDIIEKTCNIQVMPSSNFIVSVNNNNLYYVSIVTPTVVLEHCYRKPSTTHEINKSGILLIEEGCHIIVDKVHIRSRNNYKTDFGKTALLTLPDRTIFTTVKILLDRISTKNMTMLPTSSETVLIRDDVSDYDRLIKDADTLIEMADFDIQLRDIKFNDILSFIGSITVSGLVFTIGLITLCYYLYKKFFSQDLWTKLSTHFAATGFIPKLFIDRIFPATPMLPSHANHYPMLPTSPPPF